MRTAKQWLEVYKAGDLPREAAKVPVERPWEHCLGGGKLGDTCTKCDRVVWPENGQLENSNCSVPDPIDVRDWNVALALYRKHKTPVSGRQQEWLHHVWLKTSSNKPFNEWVDDEAQPHHYIIAACTAKEK